MYIFIIAVATITYGYACGPNSYSNIFTTAASCQRDIAYWILPAIEGDGTVYFGHAKET